MASPCSKKRRVDSLSEFVISAGEDLDTQITSCLYHLGKKDVQQATSSLERIRRFTKANHAKYALQSPSTKSKVPDHSDSDAQSTQVPDHSHSDVQSTQVPDHSHSDAQSCTLGISEDQNSKTEISSVDNNCKRKMTEKSNYDDREVKKIKSQELSTENTNKDLPNPTCTVAATNTTSNQRNFTSNEQQQNLYSNFEKEIQHQISLTQKKKRQSN
ncbi:unnamed protein product [Mytilus coruscus]|uniref:Uncharacterized protein n=1 Tax=Mytilus coruscus TaxID=42192 RepID=A0A6J8AAE0_MYTCO|nr:unnamed protein product [Mytilus coruscus]